uniref:Putative indole-3-pyruvate monooxygenase YUCCA11 n=1 Tax=Davidia involucrata TaxID=16924 RepID=A0A5B6YT21_DAVIN
MVCSTNFLKTTDYIDGNDDLSFLVRQVHVTTKEMVQLGMFLLKFLPCKMVDYIILMLSKLKNGDLSCYGLPRLIKGPFYLKGTTGRTWLLSSNFFPQFPQDTNGRMTHKAFTPHFIHPQLYCGN